MAQSATHRAPGFGVPRHHERSALRHRLAGSRRVAAIVVAFTLLAFSGLLGTISLVEMREPLMAVAAVALPVCLVAASFALSIADRAPRRG